MTYKVADKLGVERKSWKTAFLTSIYNETATVHGRIDRSEKSGRRHDANQYVHGRIDRSEKSKGVHRATEVVHGRIDRSENFALDGIPATIVHGRIDRSEKRPAFHAASN